MMLRHDVLSVRDILGSFYTWRAVMGLKTGIGKGASWGPDSQEPEAHMDIVTMYAPWQLIGKLQLLRSVRRDSVLISAK